jgi:serine-type D-Ala-D-Ala endopeptidase (penicillin-binding protein 7)
VMKRPSQLSVIGGVLVLCVTFGAPSTFAQTSTKKSTSSSSRTSQARARAAARARQASLERQLRAAMTPQYKKDLLGNVVPDVRAAAAIIYDPQTNAVLWEENSQDQRSIASLTKLMTTVTFMADEPDLSQQVTVTSADTRNASTTYIRAGERISYDNLLHLALIASDNAAARVLARTSEGGTAAFVARMNEMAVHLGLTSTHYADPSGLDARNVSSAYDVSHVIAFAAGDAVLGPIMRTAEYEVQTSRRTISVHSTNKLLGTEIDVLGGKTGFISKAGYCLATLVQIPQGPQVAVVVLGAANSTTRFWEARHLVNWIAARTQGLIGGPPQTPDPPRH